MPPASTYYIIEHPRRGTLKDLGETNAGGRGRFSVSGSRDDETTTKRFRTVEAAFKAIGEITPTNRREGCQVRSNHDTGTYLGAWPVVKPCGCTDPSIKEQRTFVTSAPILVQADDISEAQAKFDTFVAAINEGELNHDGLGRFDDVVIMEDNSSFEEIKD